MASGSDKRGAELISPPFTHKSPIQKHFGLHFTEENGRRIPVPNAHATCKHCFVDVSYKSWNTSNMATHLKRHHPSIALNTAARKRSAPHSQMRLQDALKVKMSINSPHALSISRSIGNSDPLLWWSQHEERFPLLATLPKLCCAFREL